MLRMTSPSELAVLSGDEGEGEGEGEGESEREAANTNASEPSIAEASNSPLNKGVD
jgi:hypothetical protein